MPNLLRLISAFVIAVLLSSCLAVAVGTATVTTVDVIHDRRTVGSYVDDGAIELKTKKFLLEDKTLRADTHINATSMNGVVLLLGESRTPELKNQVVGYVASVDGVRQVIDQIKILGKSGWLSRTNDGWLTAKVKTKLYSATGFDANRVKVVTEHGTVYLMGVVTRAEADEATEVVRRIDGVVRVVKVFEYVD